MTNARALKAPTAPPFGEPNEVSETSAGVLAMAGAAGAF